MLPDDSTWESVHPIGPGYFDGIPNQCVFIIGFKIEVNGQPQRAEDSESWMKG